MPTPRGASSRSASPFSNPVALATITPAAGGRPTRSGASISVSAAGCASSFARRAASLWTHPDIPTPTWSTARAAASVPMNADRLYPHGRRGGVMEERRRPWRRPSPLPKRSGLCDADVVAAYPITPQTHIVEHLRELVADGELDAEFVPVESEHSAMSVCCGTSAAGARTFTATASQGLALMHEILFIASALRLPIVMSVANRSPVRVPSASGTIIPMSWPSGTSAGCRYSPRTPRRPSI